MIAAFSNPLFVVAAALMTTLLTFSPFKPLRSGRRTAGSTPAGNLLTYRRASLAVSGVRYSAFGNLRISNELPFLQRTS